MPTKTYKRNKNNKHGKTCKNNKFCKKQRTKRHNKMKGGSNKPFNNIYKPIEKQLEEIVTGIYYPSEDEGGLFGYLIQAIECNTDKCHRYFEILLSSDLLDKTSSSGRTLLEIAEFRNSAKFIKTIKHLMKQSKVPSSSGRNQSSRGAAASLRELSLNSGPSAGHFASAGPAQVFGEQDLKKRKKFAIKIRELYDLEARKFPQWVNTDDWQTFNFDDTKVFYFDDTDSQEILMNVNLMVKEREPCNIGMNRHYKPDDMKTNFGWGEGAYSKVQTNRDLMPNIAIYTNAVVKFPFDYPTNEQITLNNVHVINLVGYAFDDKRQPDYQFFIGTCTNKNGTLNEDKFITDLVEKYEKMWLLAFAAANVLQKEGKIHSIRIFNVGGSAFAEHIPGGAGNFINNIFLPSFAKSKALFERKSIDILGFNFKTSMFDSTDVFNVPNSLVEEDYERILYVNAWDPWSLIGNGNQLDRSLDGWWGRSSNMSILGWSLTNPFMQVLRVHNNGKSIGIKDNGFVRV